tara:strand:- start:9499 stop:9726 length:228 start_codon:yes stop_codon:yes gene_type:complete
MKTLFERLKPEVIEKLNLQSQEFPNTITKLFSDLQENKFISDLLYDTILSIGSHYYSNVNVGYFEIDNLFARDLE